MNRKTSKWLLLTVLAGLLATAPAVFAQGFHRTKLGVRANIHRNRVVHRATARQIHRDRVALRFDRRQFGAASWQARADRHQLRHNLRRFHRQARHLHRDQAYLRYHNAYRYR